MAAPRTAQPVAGFAGFRSVASAALIMAIAAGVSFAATTLVPPSADREVLRSNIVQPFDPRAYPSPLVGFRAYEQPARAGDTLFTVHGLPNGARIRIATLDSYDGIVYAVGTGTTRASGSFTRVPFAFDQSAIDGTPVRIQVRAEDYQGVWLPTVGQFEPISFAGAHSAELRDSFFYNDVTGTAAVVHRLSPGDSYTLSAVLPDPADRRTTCRPRARVRRGASAEGAAG